MELYENCWCEKQNVVYHPDECVKDDSKDDKPHIVGRVRQRRKTESSSLISY